MSNFTNFEHKFFFEKLKILETIERLPMIPLFYCSAKDIGPPILDYKIIRASINFLIPISYLPASTTTTTTNRFFLQLFESNVVDENGLSLETSTISCAMEKRTGYYSELFQCFIEVSENNIEKNFKKLQASV